MDDFFCIYQIFSLPLYRISSLCRLNTHGLLTYNIRMIHVGYTYYYASDMLTKPQYPPRLADPKHHNQYG